MTAFAYHLGFDFRTGIRNKTQMFLYYLFPLALYLMMGAIMPQLNEYFLDVMIPAMVTFAVLAATLLGIPELLVNARENGVFRSYRINGVPATSILFIPAITTTLHICIVSIIIMVTAPLLFDAPLPENMLAFALSFLALAFASSGLGVLVGVVAPDTRGSMLLSQLVFIPSMLIGGMMIPYNALAEGIGNVSRLLPATHAMNAFNGMAMGETADFSPGGSIAILVAGGVLAFALALYLFSWDRQNATRRGHPALALLVLVPYAVGIFML
jgi:ABC-2 type transport system permease protein